MMFAHTRELAKFSHIFYINSVIDFFSKFIKCKKSGVWGPMVVTDDRRCRYPPSECPKCKFSLQTYLVSKKKLWIVNYLPLEMITIPSNSRPPQDPFLFAFVTNCIHFRQFPPEKRLFTSLFYPPKSIYSIHLLYIHFVDKCIYSIIGCKGSQPKKDIFPGKIDKKWMQFLTKGTKNGS